MERAALFVRRSVWPRIAGVFTGPATEVENRRLKRELASLSMIAAEADRLARENEKLRRSLDYPAGVSRDWLAAPVLAGHTGVAGRRDRIRVGKGRLDGVAAGSPAAGPAGLVGIVDETTAHTAVIALITDPSVKVACSVELPGGRSASGILEGGDGGSLRLTHIRGMSRDAPGAPVVTSGRGGVFPKGLRVGAVASVREGASGEWSGETVPSVDFQELEDVFISRER